MAQLIAGRYEPLSVLGEGASASVLEARDRIGGGPTVALKRLPAGRAELALEEFRRLRAFHHPGIPRALELGLDPADGQLHFTSEVVHGADFLRALRSAPLERQLTALADLLRTLALLDERGVVHRDLKPSNLIVEEAGAASTRVVLIDFGLAVTGPTQQLAGSLPWLAPELFEGAPATHASDLYSLGVVLFELWNGSHPYPAESPVEWARSHRTRPAAFVPDRAPPPALARVVLRLLEKDPRRRYAHARDVLADVAPVSPLPLPRETRRTLAGRIRSLPRSGASWLESTRDAGAAAGPTFVLAPTRAGRDDLLRDLRAAAVAAGSFPITIRFGAAGDGAAEPLAALLAQLRVLQPGRSEDDLLVALRAGAFSRRAALFAEEIDRRAPSDDALLRLLLRAPGDVVASSAADPSGDAVVRSLLERPEAARRITARPLAASEVVELFPAWLGAPAPPELARFLGLERGIDPATLVETLSYLADCGALEVDAGACRLDLARADLGRAGGDLLDLVRRRLALLPAAARAAVALLAVLDAEVAPELLERFGVAREDLAKLVDDGFVERRGDRFDLADAALRAAALAALPPAELRELHARAARTLGEEPLLRDGPLRIARHAFRAAPDRPDRERGLGYVLAGLKLLETSRLIEAAEVAAEVRAARLGGVADAAAALLQGCVELRRDSVEAAERTLAPLAGLLPAGPLRARALAEHARALERRGRLADALARLDEAGESLADDVQAQLQRAFVLHLLGRNDEAAQALDRARRALPPAADFANARWHNLRGSVLHQLGRFDDARAELVRASELATAIGNPIAAAAAENNLARLEDDCGRLGAALHSFERAHAIAAGFGDRYQEANTATFVAQVHYYLGRTDDARRELQRAREILHALKRPAIDRRRVALQQAQVALAEGASEAARAAIDEALALAAEAKDRRGGALARFLDAEWWLRDGKPRRAREALRRALEEAPTDDPDLAAYAAEFRLSHAAFAGGRPRLRAAISALPPCSASVKRRAQRNEALLQAALRLRDHARARALADEQVALIEGSDLVALRAQALAARCLCVAAEQGDVRELADAARGAIAASAAPGHAARRAEAALWLGLATREREHLDLACDLAERARHLPLLRRARRVRASLVPALATASTPLLERMLLLKEVAKAISAQTDGEQLLRMVLDHAIEHTRARRGFLILDQDGRTSVRAARNIDENDIAEPEFSFSSSIARAVARDGKSCLLSDVTADERFRHASSISQLKLVSVLCVPMRRAGKVVGSLYVDDPTRVDAFGEADLRFVEDLSDFAAIALEKAGLLKVNVERQGELERTNQALEEARHEVERLNDRLRRTVELQALELSEVKESLQQKERELKLRYDYAPIVSQSAIMHDVKRRIDQFTDSDLPVFISGESGTGKELVARLLHQNGPRKGRPLESLNCASMPAPLVESELFGHAKGAFTGADADKPGTFERADGGTLFLDEICDASPELQAKLLRAVQFGEVQRVGGGTVRKVDVRLVAASNRDVMKEVAAGRFREDLMYRLLVLKLHLPPLRDRRDDVPLLLRHLIERHAGRLGARPLQFSPAAQRRLLTYAWPGNVRELENCVQQLLVLHRGGEPVEEGDLPDNVLAGTGADEAQLPPDLRHVVEEAERAAILDALRRQGGNRQRAAHELGISERGLYLKLQKLGLTGTREAATGGGPPPAR
jgi:transcriptional regulator with GAF, ATPase, and Fis domain/tetratricopeptide (TPR) repeat protein